MNANEIETILRARAAFESSVNHLDDDTCRRLRASRMRALADARPVRNRWVWPVGMAAAAAAALTVVLLLPHPPRQLARTTGATTALVAPPGPPNEQQPVAAGIRPTDSGYAAEAPDPAATDSAALETADPDLLSDLDFYGWLAAQPADKNPMGG